MSALAWQIPIWALITVIAVRLVLAPYWLAREDADEIRKLKATEERTFRKEHLQKLYIESGRILAEFENSLSLHSSANKDAQKNAEAFMKVASTWIHENIGPAANARFLDLGSEGNERDASEWRLKLRRKNLAQLVESEHWD